MCTILRAYIGSDSRWRLRRILELTPSHRHNESTNTCGIISSEKVLKMRCVVASTTKDKRDALGKRSREVLLPKPLPEAWQPTVRGISKVWNFSLKSQGFDLHIMYSNAWVLHCRDKPPKYLALKTNGEHIQENHKTIGNRESTFKGLVCRLTYAPWGQHKSSNLKSTYTICEGYELIFF